MCGPIHIRYLCEKPSCGRYIHQDAITLVCTKAWENGHHMTCVNVVFISERAAFGLCGVTDEPHGTQWLAFSECDRCVDAGLEGLEDDAAQDRERRKDIKRRRRMNLFESAGFYWVHMYMELPNALGAEDRGGCEKMVDHAAQLDPRAIC